MHTRSFFNFLSFLSCLALITPTANSIVRRDDRSDSSYVALGTNFPAVCLINPGAAGTLIAPQWVITAGHVGEGLILTQSKPLLEFAGRQYAIQEIFVHPCGVNPPAHDMALFKLAKPVPDVTPLELYRGRNESGQVAFIVGLGYQGTGRTGPVQHDSWDKVRRAATNVVESADEFWITFVFDPPPNGTDLEGIGGPGDSGGPSVIEVDGTYYLIGISSGGSDKNKDGINGTYGDWDRHSRVSTEIPWIEATMAGRLHTPECYDKFLALKWIGGFLLVLLATMGLLFVRRRHARLAQGKTI